MTYLIRIKNKKILFVEELCDSFDRALYVAKREMQDKDISGDAFNYDSEFVISLATKNQIKRIENYHKKLTDESNRRVMALTNQ